MPRYFDNDLPCVSADKLKPMAKIWGGESKMRKEECIACITSGLKDPQKVQVAISRLEPWERNALAFVKLMGGVIPSATLKIGIRISGLHPSGLSHYQDDIPNLLFRRGLILVTGFYSPDSIGDGYGYNKLFYSDERLLAQVGQPECLPLEIQPAPPPRCAATSATIRSPARQCRTACHGLVHSGVAYSGWPKST